MKRITIVLLLLSLQCGKGFGVVMPVVDAPKDDGKVLGSSDYQDCFRNDPELQSLASDYIELVHVRFWPLKMKDIAAIFGAKLDHA